MWEYEIELIGCDDSTCFKMYLTMQEFELLKWVAELSRKTSTSRCMPKMEITKIEDM